MASQTVDALIEGGKASAAPPLGPALGPLGVNIGKVVAEINTMTGDFKGMKVLGLNSQALIVDPRVVLRDERFKSESDDAESVFAEMSPEEIEKMQKNFVDAVGGKWSALTDSKKSRVERLKKESTYEVTRELLVKGLGAEQIARERKMALSTVWGHIEKLAEEGKVGREHMNALIPSNISWKSAYLAIAKAYDKHGTEKLKPVYEETGEKYDYNAIRLGRILYTMK